MLHGLCSLVPDTVAETRVNDQMKNGSRKRIRIFTFYKHAGTPVINER